MLRAARPLNLVALSPTVKQRAAMKAPECLPLIFEPGMKHFNGTSATEQDLYGFASKLENRM